MVHIVGFLLIALAAGFRSKSDPASPWDEHPASSAEELQGLLRTALAEANTSEAAGDEPSDAEAQEEILKERVAIIMKDWQSASAGACHQQLGRLMNNLTLACESAHPKADWLLDYYDPILPNKTCADSVSDIFALGNELVETLRVSRDAVASVDVAGETLRRYQALSFLRSWLVELTETHHRALLWAGFWDGDPESRTTQAALSNFAKAIEHATVHPNTFLGRAIEASENLDACYEDALTRALAGNMWSIASMSFVLGMRERAQGTVIALVNKQITGERSLSESVLSTHEIPTLGLAAWGLGFWSPKVLVVDLMGTCDKTSPALQKRLLARLPSWAKAMTNWSPEAFATRSRLQWQCIDCSGACSLDKALAQHVEKLVEAKEVQDRKDQELRQVVSPRLAASAADKLSKNELSLTHKLLITVVKSSESRTRELSKHLKARAWEAQLGMSELDGPERQLHVEHLLQENADPNPPDLLGHTALIYAALEGRVELVETLLKASAQLEAHDEQGSTALISAATNGHLKVVEALVKAGAQLEARNQIGHTSLIVAAVSGHLKVVEVLVKAGAQLEARSQIGGYTSLMLAAVSGHLKVVEVLVKAGAQLEARNEDGRTAGSQVEGRHSEQGFTALMWAAISGHLHVVEALLEAGAQPQARDAEGKTALDRAQDFGHLQIADILRKHIVAH
ncbi:unnamed protein product [Symbiodinium sp. CCMP2592]|nr:unnamed protein product [Symbiodinium sp. CCMP2592]